MVQFKDSLHVMNEAIKFNIEKAIKAMIDGKTAHFLLSVVLY